MKKIRKEIWFYLRLYGIYRTTRLAKACIAEMSGDHYFRSKYVLVDMDGNKFENPVFTKTHIETLLPIDVQTIQNTQIHKYVDSVMFPMDSVFYEAGVGSMVVKSWENKYTADEKEDLVVVVSHKVNYRYLRISMLVYIAALASIGISIAVFNLL